MMSKTELHLFCLWKHGIEFSDDVLQKIGEKFTILQVEDIVWSGHRGVRGMCRFYTNPAWIIFWKYLRCGGVPVRMIVVRDESPCYARRNTNSGEQTVNTKMFDTKMLFRKQLPNGHLIHATNSSFEFAFNYAVLTGGAPDGSKLLDASPWDGVIRRRETPCPGTRPWRSLEEFFSVLTALDGTWMVLRNFENLPDDCRLGAHSDIDILSDHPQEFIRLAGLRRASWLPFRAVWRARVGDSYVNIDLRTPTDGYYPPAMAEMLLRCTAVHRGIPVPAPEAYFYSLAYHALVHKYNLSDDYSRRLLNMAETLGQKPDEGEPTPDFLSRLLREWMTRMNLEFSEPRDLTVAFNRSVVREALPVSLKRRLKDTVWRWFGLSARAKTVNK
jgi:hypothetical protein